MLEIGGRAPDLDWLMDLAGGISWPRLQSLWLHPNRSFHFRQSPGELEWLWRRHLETAEPLQYLVGRCPWRDLELQVGPGVLIPRQETELLVELALSLATSSLPDGVSCTWADLGTGSGCLAISLARALPQSLGVATDISSEALALARVNADGAGLSRRIEMRRANWWQGLEPWWGKLALVVANPPYIPSATVETLEPVVRLHEPLLALDGGADGLVAIRQVVEGAREGLAPGGVIVLEHHHDQSEAVCALLEEAGLEAVASHRDLEGTLRFASARRRGPLPYM
jgi:release factor glutamine methyltransferase